MALDRFVKPHTIAGPINAEDIDDNFNRIWQIVRELRAAVLAPGGGGDIPNPLPINRGGTNAQTALAAFDNLSPLTTLGDLLTHDGSNNVRLALGAVGFVPVARAGGVVWEAVPVPVHQLLDTPVHDDTATDPPSRGAIVVGAFEAIDGQEFWLDGLPYDGMSGDDNAGQQYWFEGLSDDVLQGGTDGLLWRRLLPPEGQPSFVKYNGTDVIFGPLGDVGSFSASAQPKAKVYLGANQEIPTGSTSGDLIAGAQQATAVEWTAEDYDQGGFWDAGTPRRLTVPGEASGFYLVTVQASWETSTSGRKACWIFVNGQRRGIAEVPSGTDDGLGLSFAAVWQGELQAGDYVEVGVQQVSGAPLDLLSGIDTTQCSLTKLT